MVSCLFSTPKKGKADPTVFNHIINSGYSYYNSFTFYIKDVASLAQCKDRHYHQLAVLHSESL